MDFFLLYVFLFTSFGGVEVRAGGVGEGDRRGGGVVGVTD
jgi:hypothetical protein